MVSEFRAALRAAPVSHNTWLNLRGAFQHNVSEATLYMWRYQYGGMAVNEARCLRALAEGNARLKRLIADYAVQI